MAEDDTIGDKVQMAKTDTNTTGEKIDRRKIKRGPRAAFFVCAAIGKDGNIVMKDIQAESQEAAEKEFKNQTKLAPAATVNGLGAGYYQIKGTSAQQGDRLVVRMDMADVVYGKNRWTAVLKGWHVMAMGLQACHTEDGDFKSDEVVWVVPNKPVDKENKAPKPRLGDVPTIRFADLESPKPFAK